VDVLSVTSEALRLQTNAFVFQLSFEQSSNDGYSSFNFTLGETGGLKGSAVKAK